MRRPLPLIAPLALATAALCTAPDAALAAESYDNCTGFIAALPAVINTQGTWCLDKDLATAIASGNAISIETNNVTIDCNDFKVGNLAAGVGTTTIGIRSTGRLNHVVRNCNVRGFHTGISLTEGGGHVVEDNRVEASRAGGIVVAGAGSSIRRNLVADTGGAQPASPTTVAITGFSNVTIVDNTVVNAFLTDQALESHVVAGIASLYSVAPVERNIVNGLDAMGIGAATGIWMVVTPDAPVVDNRVHAAGLGGFAGIHCQLESSMARTRDNMVADYATGILGCGNAGNNDVMP